MPTDDKIIYKSDTPWEEKYSYSRGIRIGNIVELSGTTASDKTGVLFPNDAAAQTKYIFEKIERTLQHLKADKTDIIRTRMYITDQKDADTIASIHGSFFKYIDPVSTLVVVQLMDPAMKVEIECSAYINDKNG